MEDYQLHFEDNFYDKRLLDLSDGRLKTEDGHVFYIHRFTLARHNKYFCALFCNSEKGRRDILIPGINGRTLRNILSFIYTGKICVTEKDVYDFIVASDYLLMDDVFPHIKAVLNQKLSVSNCLSILTFTETINRTNLTRVCYRFVQLHFESLVNHEDSRLAKLSLETLKKLLSDRSLCVRNEMSVWLAIIKWTDEDPSHRIRWVPNLLMSLALSDVDENMAAMILEHDYIAENPFCQRINDRKKKFSNLENLQIFHRFFRKHTILTNNQRTPKKLHFIILRKKTTFPAITEIHITYDEKIDLWRKMDEMVGDYSPDYLYCVNDRIYMFQRSSKHVCYDAIKRRWCKMSSFEIPRFNHVIVCTEKDIYALGGVSAVTSNDIFIVEIYDSENDAWHVISEMEPMYDISAASLDKLIYIIGYRFQFQGFQTLFQVYDPKRNIWIRLKEPKVARFHSALAVYKRKIYVIGGVNGKDHTRAVEIFDPVKNKWKSEVHIPYAYYMPKAIVLNEKLIVYDNYKDNLSGIKINPAVQWNSTLKYWETFEESLSVDNFYDYEFLTLCNKRSIALLTKENRESEKLFTKSPFA